MADRAAIITGGSGGIGLAIARALGERGYALTLSARRPEKLEAAVEGLRADGFELQTVPANVANEEELVAVFAAHKERYGRLDALANNAGVGIGGPMEQIRHQIPRHAAGGQPALADHRHPRGAAAAARGRRRARQGADPQHRLDRRQRRPGLPLDLRRDQGRGDQLHPGDGAGNRRRRDPVHGARPRLRRHRDDRLRQGRGAGGEDDPAVGHRRGGQASCSSSRPTATSRRSSSTGPGEGPDAPCDGR